MKLRQCKSCDLVFKTTINRAKLCPSCVVSRKRERIAKTNWNGSPYYKRSSETIRM